jgi:hypothetical protein
MPSVKSLISSYYSQYSNSKPEVDIDDYDESYGIKQQSSSENLNQNRKSESIYHSGKKKNYTSTPKPVAPAKQLCPSIFTDPGPPKPIQRNYPVSTQSTRLSMPLVSKDDEDFILVCRRL